MQPTSIMEMPPMEVIDPAAEAARAAAFFEQQQPVAAEAQAMGQVAVKVMVGAPVVAGVHFNQMHFTDAAGETTSVQTATVAHEYMAATTRANAIQAHTNMIAQETDARLSRERDSKKKAA